MAKHGLGRGVDSLFAANPGKIEKKEVHQKKKRKKKVKRKNVKKKQLKLKIYLKKKID